MPNEAVARALPHVNVSPLEWPIARFFRTIANFFAVGFEVFSEAQEQARKAHAKYPFAE